MTDFHALIHSYQNCACGQAHECAIRDIEIGSGLVSETGEILKKNGFGPRLLLAADMWSPKERPTRSHQRLSQLRDSISQAFRRSPFQQSGGLRKSSSESTAATKTI